MMIEKFLICPYCKSSLAHEGKSLKCLICDKNFNIIDGVYDFSFSSSKTTEETVKRFSKSWQFFSHIEDYHKEQFSKWISPFTLENFKDKIVFEAGCGKGRHTYIVSNCSPKLLVSSDLGESIFIAVEQIRRLKENRENISFLRCDLKDIPLVDEVFDIVFCVGVLHHIDDYEKAFSEFLRILKKGGKLILWVYGKEGNEVWLKFFNPIRKRFTSKINPYFLRIISFLVSLPIYLLLKLIYGPITHWGKKDSFLYYSTYMGAISRYPFKELFNIVYDHFCPSVAYYFSKNEIVDLLKKFNIEKYELRWHNRNSWTIILEKS